MKTVGKKGQLKRQNGVAGEPKGRQTPKTTVHYMVCNTYYGERGDSEVKEVERRQKTEGKEKGEGDRWRRR